jgi:hypothetical protein
MGLFKIKRIIPKKVRKLSRALYNGIRARVPSEISKIKQNPKQSAMSFAIATKDLAAELLPLAATVPGILLGKYFLAPADEPFSWKKVVGNDIFGPYLIGSVLSNTMQRLGPTFSRRLPFLAGPAQRQRASLAKQFHAQQKNMPEDFVRAGNDAFVAWDAALAFPVGTPVSSFAAQINALLRFPFTGRPRISKKEFDENIKDAIDGVIQHYEPVLMGQYAELVKEIIGSNINDSEPKRVKTVLLLGPSGVGKTTSIEKIATILGIPLVLKKLAGVSHAELVGNSSFGSDKAMDLGMIFTAFLEAKKESGHGTVILLLDELDKALKGGEEWKTAHLREFLIQVLNPEVVEWQSDALQVKFPITNLIIVITANTDPFLGMQEGEKKAFQDRVRYFHFPPYKPDAQLAIVMACFNQLKNKLSLQEKLNQIGDTENVVKDLDEKFVHEIVECNIVQKRPGVRIALLVLQSYIAYVKHREYFRDWRAKPFSINDRFDEYASLENEKKSEVESAAGSENASTNEAAVVDRTSTSLVNDLLAVTGTLKVQTSSSNDSNFGLAPVGKPMLTAMSTDKETEAPADQEPKQAADTLRHRRPPSPQSQAIIRSQSQA